jgi:hypothetical protein
MLSIFTNIKKKIINIFNTNKTNKRLRNYEVVLGTDIMTVKPYDDNDDNDDADDNNNTHEYITDELIAPPPSPIITRKLFNVELDVSIIKKDYELQELLKMMDIHQIDVSNVTLEQRFEKSVNDIEDADDVVKTKMRLLYIIIANNIYRTMFEEKKQYSSKKNNQYLGVFRYNDFIIRIDDCPYSFMNEADVIKATAKFNKNSQIIRPFLLYMNILHNYTTNDTCDCRNQNCDCIYTDNAEDEFTSNDERGVCTNELARRCFDKLRKNTISFSIQHYVKDTVSLYTWVKDNLAIDVYNRFSSIQHTFFIHLFYKCALLLQEIHSVSIVHGDIKPDNILIREHVNFNIDHHEKCKNFTVYLIDFGLSGFHRGGIGTGGTIPYCHPEFKNKNDTTRSSKYNWKTLDMKHDVWSLGITFLTMYIYRDFYNYYNKYPSYFFLKDGYVSSLIIDVITDKKLNSLFTKMMTVDCIPSQDICDILKGND